ncbi:hypothetical protein JB92DRAFT_2818098 [Gautieria morchelliformis]|nr:hypothetical protein JB92DRAFT_2818098 [Gautieria morchelliformis]
MISMEGTLLESGSPHSLTPTSPSFNVAPAARQRAARPETPLQNIPLEPPPGVPFLDFLRQWNDGHVARWLADNKCAHHAQSFANHDIRGDILLDLDQQTLREMGIASVGDRIKILNAVKSLRQRSSKSHQRDLQRLPMTLHIEPPQDPPSPVRSALPRRLENGRPPPLHLAPAASRDLPQLVRENARQRPLPQPQGHTHTLSSSPGNLGGGRTPAPAIAARSTSPLPPPRSRTLALQPGAAHSRSPSNPVHHPYASSTPALHPPPNAGPVLSPIAESFMAHHPPGNTTPSPPTAGPSTGYSVGRGPFRPTTPAGRAPMSAEDIRRKCLKFILADDGHSRVVNVEDIPRGSDVLETVLRKFGKFGGIGFPSMDPDDLDSTDPDQGLVVDGWGVFLDDGLADSPGKHLSESELLFICHAEPDNPAREHGLTLRRIGKPKRSKALSRYFGEAPPLRATTPSPVDTPPAPPPPDPRTVKQMNRASSISILSGLGVPDPERALAPPLPDVMSPSKPASPTPSFRAKTQNKLRNFLGQRPPSELITTHLQEYFPFTEKRVLERTQRQSMMLRAGHTSTGPRPDSQRFDRQSWNQPSESRFSASTGTGCGSPSRKSTSSPPFTSQPDAQSVRSTAASTRSAALSIRSNASGLSVERDDAPPRMSVETADGTAIDITDDDDHVSVSAEPHLLPPVQFPSESLSESLGNLGRGLARTSSNASRMSRRVSYLMELRSKRDRSDTASMLTVDEITQEVESRRASLVAEGRDPGAEGAEDGDTGTSTAVDTEEDTAVEEPEVEEDEAEDTAVNDASEGEEEAHKAVTSNGGKRAFKWIKGALIGAGSFGSVYLGMDAFHGLLMAVKQVELPTGSAPNEERKKSMLSALEREIELLKELQHENIVQYLDSSSDGVHLNIFLEYVPGGSVAALLKNYGAFEEALVRNFVRQILQGLNYLHEREIIHRDIKGGNILVDNKGGIKISDFGISKKVEDSILSGARMHRPSLQGSVFWMAPEVVKQTSYTLKADIWSVGCLVVEMLTGEHPWAQLTQMQAIFKIGSSAKPACPSDISADAEDFLNQTFELDHNLRPSASTLLLHPWITKDPANPASASKPKTAKTLPTVTVTA